MIRKSKGYVRPKKAYESTRIKDENITLEKYGLKNKREIWKSIARISYFRRRAKSLSNSSEAEQQVLFGKLNEKGIKVNSIADVLALTIEDLLKRRLPTVVFKKGLSTTVRQARQLVTHKKILINGEVVNSPSYIVSVSEEDSISLRAKKKAEKPVQKIEEENKDKIVGEEK